MYYCYMTRFTVHGMNVDGSSCPRKTLSLSGRVSNFKRHTILTIFDNFEKYSPTTVPRCSSVLLWFSISKSLLNDYSKYHQRMSAADTPYYIRLIPPIVGATSYKWLFISLVWKHSHRYCYYCRYIYTHMCIYIYCSFSRVSELH